MTPCDLQKFTDILEEQDASVFRIEAREWSQHIPSQHLQVSTRLECHILDDSTHLGGTFLVHNGLNKKLYTHCFCTSAIEYAIRMVQETNERVEFIA